MVTLILTLNIQDKIYLCLQKRKDEEGAMDDSTLIEQIQLGSKDAFKQMFIKFYSPLCEYASQYVSDEDAEELIQELMLFIWENRNSLFVEISLKSYLFMAVKHRCLNAIKRQLYHERVHSLIYDKIKVEGLFTFYNVLVLRILSINPKACTIVNNIKSIKVILNYFE